MGTDLLLLTNFYFILVIEGSACAFIEVRKNCLELIRFLSFLKFLFLTLFDEILHQDC